MMVRMIHRLNTPKGLIVLTGILLTAAIIIDALK
jgi:hypothetical protein